MKSALVLFIFILGCQSGYIKNDLSTIALSNKNSKKIKIRPDHTSYGPSPLSHDYTQSEQTQLKIVGLNLSSLLYNSLLYVPLIKKLKDKQIEIHVIGGFGFTSAIAALYAKSKNINEFEWKIFKLYKKIERHAALSGDWQESLREFLKEEFKKLRVYELDKLLLIPKVKNSNIVYEFDTYVVDAVMDSVTKRSSSNFFINPKEKLTLAFKDISKCDVCINVAFKINKLFIKSNDGDKLQIYSRILSKVQSSENYYFIENINSSVDILYGLEIFYRKYDKNINRIVQRIVSDSNFIKDTK